MVLSDVPIMKTSGKPVLPEKAGYILNAKRMYKDLNDEQEEIYRFYVPAMFW